MASEPTTDETMTGEALAGNTVTGQAMADDTIAGEAVAGGAITGEAMAGDMMSGQAMAGDAIAGEAVAGDAMTGQAMAGDRMSGEAMAVGNAITGEAMTGDMMTGQAVAGGVNTGEAMAGDTMTGEAMAGGVNTVLRIGDRVHRPAGEWTPAVHALLDHLAAKGFSGAPRVHGFDAEGREVLDFVPGDVPGSEVVVSDEALADMAVLLRGLHDATADFIPPAGSAWYFEPREPFEVICHGDVAPYNTVFRDGRPVALIDFDTAHPAPRVWDVAYAAYRFVQLVEESGGEGGAVAVGEQSRRLALFADAYGLGGRDRAVLIDTLVARLRHLVGFMRGQAAAGHPAFGRHVAEGHDRYYLENVAYIERCRFAFDAVLVGRGLSGS